MSQQILTWFDHDKKSASMQQPFVLQLWNILQVQLPKGSEPIIDW